MGKIPYGKHKITKDDINRVIEVLQSDCLTQGPRVKQFEKSFSKFVGCKYSVAVSNGTGALHLASIVLEIKDGDKVITTPNSFIATANSARYCGAEILFCDIDKNTKCLDIEKLTELLRSHEKGSVKAVYTVSFAGYPYPMDRLDKLAKEYNFKVLEDACHAIGGRYKAKNGEWFRSGSCFHSDVSVFSLHPVKHIAAGEGGVITTNNEGIYKHLLRLRTHGIEYEKENFVSLGQYPWEYEMQELGFNYRLSEIHASLALSQLSRIDENIQHRQAVARRYDLELGQVQEITIQILNENMEHGYHLYVIEAERRMELYTFLRRNDIYTQVHYVPIHKQPYYLSLNKVKLEGAERYYENCLSLPMYHTLSPKEQGYVIKKIKEFYN